MYIFDTNVLVEPFRLYYQFEICPAFWDWLDDLHAAGRLHSAAAVFGEIVRAGDALSNWARPRRDWFMLPGPNTAGSLTAVANWVMGHDAYRQSAKEEFLRVADHQLVALAHENEWSVVTHEIAAPDSETHKVPDVCRVLGVPCLTVFGVLRAEGPRFVLARGGG